MPDGGEDLILACPYCDAGGVEGKAPGGEHLRDHPEDYRCRECGEHFDEPVERFSRRPSGGSLGPVGKLLDEAEPEAIPDGGVESTTYEHVFETFDKNNETIELPDDAVGVSVDTFSLHAQVHYLRPVRDDPTPVPDGGQRRDRGQMPGMLLAYVAVGLTGVFVGFVLGVVSCGV
jgi:hypothetical protein